MTPRPAAASAPQTSRAPQAPPSAPSVPGASTTSVAVAPGTGGSAVPPVDWDAMSHHPENRRHAPVPEPGTAPRAVSGRRARRARDAARALVPASAAWREGDDVGDRLFADLGPLDLEAGGRLPAVRIAYETWGTLNAARDNAV